MSNPQHEPTMEEILASIRKIISEDTPDAPAPVLAAVPPAQDDVLELTQEIDAPLEAPAPEFVADNPTPHSDIFSDHTRQALEDTFAAIPDEPPPAPPAAAPVRFAPAAPADGASVESVFERAVRESFEPVLQKYLGDNSSAVIERMKPAIREWMDEHFPALLEGVVRAEVERVVKSRGARR